MAKYNKLSKAARALVDFEAEEVSAKDKDILSDPEEVDNVIEDMYKVSV
jgi:hypothetical protein